MAESTISLFGRPVGYLRVEISGILADPSNKFKCIGIRLLWILIHFHWGKLVADEMGEETWPKFRLRRVEIFGRRMPLLYWPI